ncbi:hypothetical protein [Actinophytocola sp.]|uniref:hypothetical protein n=1 Tax=Actinophytocola sp. TaxID=1872138 RepID=UPI002ED7C130
MLELTLLQAMRLKGRLSADAAAACVGMSADDTRSALDRLVAEGHAAVAGAAFRLAPGGRERLAALLDEERAAVDQEALTRAYADFDEINTDLKNLITAWQLRDPGTPNDHSDAAYDAEVLDRLAALHERFTPLLDRVAAAAARLAPYRTRFGTAIDKVRAGDHTFVARPIADSYHTVWFELHEELIGLLGRTRAEEAAAGRAV